MLPFNYAILKQFASGGEADAEEVMRALKDTYGAFKNFKKKSVVEALMTAHENGLLEETRVKIENNEELRVFYKANEYGLDMIGRYIKG
jgi:DNA-binding PadR family transcriptional regulator